ncbi:unnamed protein product [Sphagnum jensenii]|uniref:Uncharacterized protein n=1 Tax=Sphagnum jensenii TaxID=128206 RepID=A0ABP1B499_9BRYO
MRASTPRNNSLSPSLSLLQCDLLLPASNRFIILDAVKTLFLPRSPRMRQCYVEHPQRCSICDPA